MVNIGGTACPFVANWAHTHFGLEGVFRISALSVFAMFFLILFSSAIPENRATSPRRVCSRSCATFVPLFGRHDSLSFFSFSLATGSFSGSSTPACPGTFTLTWMPTPASSSSSSPMRPSWCASPSSSTIRPKDSAVPCCYSRHCHFFDVVACLSVLADSRRRGCFNLRFSRRRNHSAAALLRIHLASCPSRPARHLHGFRISSYWNRLAGRRLVRRDDDASLR